jgi:hypothetical protein
LKSNKMYAIIGEDRSDINTLKVLVRRLANDNSISIHGKGYEGCAQMLRKGAVQLAMFSRAPMNCKRFIVCYDSDGNNPSDRRKEVISKILVPSGVDGAFCVVIPVEELEAWILADLQAVNHVIKGWKPTEDYANPEREKDPKELIERLSRDSKKVPRYSNAVHNERVAVHVNLAKVADRCPSFVPLVEFVRKGTPNCGVTGPRA